jgi:hypothetical protein
MRAVQEQVLQLDPAKIAGLPSVELVLIAWQMRLTVDFDRAASGPSTSPKAHEETEHRYEVKSSDDAGSVDGRDGTEAQDGQDQLRRSDRGGV